MIIVIKQIKFAQINRHILLYPAYALTFLRACMFFLVLEEITSHHFSVTWVGLDNSGQSELAMVVDSGTQFLLELGSV